MEKNTKVNQTIFKVIKIAFSIMIALLVVYGTMTASVTAFDFGYRVFTEPPMSEEPGREVSVTVTEGMDGEEIGEMLWSKGLIRDANLFYLQYVLSAYKDEIIPGTYALNTDMTAKEMMIIMAQQESTEEE